MRQRRRIGKEAIHPLKLHGQPEQRHRGVVLPSARRFCCAACDEQRGKHRIGCAHEHRFPVACHVMRIEQHCKQRHERRDDPSAFAKHSLHGSEDLGCSQKKFKGKKYRRDGESDNKSRSAEASEHSEDRGKGNNRGPDGDRRRQFHLPGCGAGWHGQILPEGALVLTKKVPEKDHGGGVGQMAKRRQVRLPGTAAGFR